MLKNYVLNGPSVVIEDDDRDPAVSWQHHLDRTGGLRPGIDLVAQTPQPVYAPTDGVMDWRKNDGTAGNSCRFWHKQNAGWADVFSHLSRYVGSDMQSFKRGDLIAYTGDTGGVIAHLHRHLLNPAGVRCNPWDFFTPTSGLAGLTPIKIEGFLMALNDAEQDELLTKTRAIWDAMFLQTPTSRGSSGGVLQSLAALERQAAIQYDVAFKVTPVTLKDGTVLPGGVLKSLAD